MFVLQSWIFSVLIATWHSTTANFDVRNLTLTRFSSPPYDPDMLNPLVMEDTMVWGGLYQEGVASKEDCETFCLDNICEVANYVASKQLCFTATDSKTIRRINTSPSLSISGGLCDVNGCNFKNNKIFLPEKTYEYAPGQNEVRSAQNCFMFCDLVGADVCPAFVFHNDDNDVDGKGNACTFYDPKVPIEYLNIAGFYSSLRSDSWAPPVV